MGCMQNRIGECGAVRHWRLSEPTFTPLLRSIQGASVVSHQGQGCLSGTQKARDACQAPSVCVKARDACQAPSICVKARDACQAPSVCVKARDALSGTQHMCQGQGCLSGTQRGKGVALIKLQISPISEKSNGICQVTNPQQC